MTEPAIHRHLELDVDADELWQLVTDPDGLATWLGDEVELDAVPGGAGRVVDDEIERHLRVERVVEGERIEWRWWTGDDPDAATRVQIVVSPLPGGSRIDVTETFDAASHRSIAPRSVAPSASNELRWDLRTAFLCFAASAGRVSCHAR